MASAWTFNPILFIDLPTSEWLRIIPHGTVLQISGLDHFFLKKVARHPLPRDLAFLSWTLLGRMDAHALLSAFERRRVGNLLLDLRHGHRAELGHVAVNHLARVLIDDLLDLADVELHADGHALARAAVDDELVRLRERDRTLPRNAVELSDEELKRLVAGIRRGEAHVVLLKTTDVAGQTTEGVAVITETKTLLAALADHALRGLDLTRRGIDEINRDVDVTRRAI